MSLWHTEEEIGKLSLKATSWITDQLEDLMPVLLHHPLIGEDYGGDRIYLAIKRVLMDLNEIAEEDEECQEIG